MFLLIDKPKGVSSHFVVNRVRRITGVKRVGHGGTLDPNATGLLIVAVGRDSTKQLNHLLLNSDKTYVAEIILGAFTDTDDSTGKKIENSSVKDIKPSINVIKQELYSFIGRQNQMPPIYSAKKVKGKTSYSYALKGQKVILKPSYIEIYSIDLLRYKYPKLKIILKVSSGTYIRALARDLGKKLGTGGYLNNLRRTKIGIFDIQNSVKLKTWEKTYKYI